MSDNPYQPPLATSEPALVGAADLSQTERDRLRAIALGQKAVLACVPLSLGMRVAIAVAGEVEPLAGQPLPITGAALAVALLTAVCIGWLASRLYGVPWGLLATLVALVPGLALLPLLIVVFQAISTLSRKGVHVGLLGADCRRQ